jgi:hypothetical protein
MRLTCDKNVRLGIPSVKKQSRPYKADAERNVLSIPASMRLRHDKKGAEYLYLHGLVHISDVIWNACYKIQRISTKGSGLV